MSLFSRMYQKVIVSIDLDIKTCKLRITYHKNKNLKQEERSYKTINADFPIEAAKYIRYIQSKYPFTYISTMSKVQNQGLLNGNKVDVFSKFGLEIGSLLVMLIDRKWFIYVSKDSMQNYKSKFNKIHGVDLIFSPFVIIYEKIKKNMLEDIKKMYILQERDSLTLLIADKNGVYFGSYIVSEQDKFIEEVDNEDDKQDKHDAIIEFDSISDIDENIIIKDFDKPNYKSSSPAGLNELTIANHMIEIIKNTLNNYYKDSRYASDFIEELLILDGYGISDNAIAYLKNNMMLETYFLRIDICEEIEKLTKMELKL